jgi:hypothetical protein
LSSRQELLLLRGHDKQELYGRSCLCLLTAMAPPVRGTCNVAGVLLAVAFCRLMLSYCESAQAIGLAHVCVPIAVAWWID